MNLHSAVIQFEWGPTGRLRMALSPHHLNSLLELNLSIPAIAKILGMSRSTVFRRMNEFNLSVKALYSSLSDEELDQCITDIKSRQPHAGYRMVKALLQARGHRVQYQRVRSSMHRWHSWCCVKDVFLGMHCSTCLFRPRTTVSNAYWHKSQTDTVNYLIFWSERYSWEFFHLQMFRTVFCYLTRYYICIWTYINYILHCLHLNTSKW